MTGAAEWGLITRPGVGLIGVHSLSTQKPLKKANFHERYTSFSGANSYREWEFYICRERPAAGLPVSVPTPSPIRTPLPIRDHLLKHRLISRDSRHATRLPSRVSPVHRIHRTKPTRPPLSGFPQLIQRTRFVALFGSRNPSNESDSFFRPPTGPATPPKFAFPANF